MAITHVLRGDEWVSTTPKHILVHRALGYEPPVFAHLPLMTGRWQEALQAAQRDRHQPVRGTGLPAGGDDQLPGAPGLVAGHRSGDLLARGADRPVRPRGISRSPAVFDLDKLSWLNGMYIRQLSPTESGRAGAAVPPGGGPGPGDGGRSHARVRARAVALEQERVRTLAEIPAATEFFFREEPVYDEKAVRKWLARPDTPPLLRAAAAALREARAVGRAALEAALRSLAEREGVNAAEIIHRVRAAVTGRPDGPRSLRDPRRPRPRPGASPSGTRHARMVKMRDVGDSLPC